MTAGGRRRPGAGIPPRAGLLAVALGFVVLATAYGAVVPAFEAPDEPQHFFLAQHLARGGGLPVQSLDEAERGPWEQEGSQPPLYYALLAPVLAASGADLSPDDLVYNHQNTMGRPAEIGNENRFVHPPGREGWPWRGGWRALHLARLVSTGLGLVTVLAAFCAARRVLGGGPGRPDDRPWLAVAAGAVVALGPQFLATSSAVTNDALVVALATATLALLLRLADGHVDAVTVAALARTAGAAPLAKLSGLAVTGFALATVAILAWRRRDAALALRAGGAIVVAAVVVSGWWYARNLALYGDPTGLSHMLPPALRRDVSAARFVAGLPAELKGAWYSVWGLFGWFTLPLPLAAYAGITAATAVAAAGLAVARARGAPPARWRRLAWLAAWGALVLAGLIRWLLYAKGAHGRLLFPALAALAVLLVAGWRAVLPPRVPDRALAATVAAALSALSAGALLAVVRPAYAWPSRVDAPPAPAAVLGVVFDGSLRLAAVDAPARVTEGDEAVVTLYWEVLAPIARDGLVALRFDQAHAPGDGGESWVVRPGEPLLAYPGAGTAPPALLAPGPGVYVDRRRVVAPTSASVDLPIAADLTIHVYDPGASAGWPAVDASGDAVDGGRVEVVVDPRQPLAVSSRPAASVVGALPSGGLSLPADALAARFEGGIAAYRVGRGDCAAPGAPGCGAWLRRPVPPETGPPDGDILWLPEGPVPGDLTAFVHLLDGTGRQIATFDRPPAAHGDYPTSRWQPGRPIPARLAWSPPAGLPPGRYRVVFGLYDPTTGARLGAVAQDGSRHPDGAAPLWEGVLP